MSSRRGSNGRSRGARSQLRKSPLSNRERGRDQKGAVLILALAYIVIVSVMVAVLTTWATNDLNNSTKFSSARSMDYAASSAVEVAINSIRYYPNTLILPTQTLNANPPSYCWQPATNGASTLTTDGFTISVWCSTAEDLGSAQTRTVTFSACLSTVSATNCAATPLLQAIVIFDDYPSGGSTPLKTQCSTYCGDGATLASWDWGTLAGSVTGPSANAITVTSTPPVRASIGGTTYTPVATANSGDTVQVSSGSPTTCAVTAGIVSFIGNGTCTVDFNDPGNANFLAAAQVRQSITVGLLANSINVTSTAPASASVGTDVHAGRQRDVGRLGRRHFGNHVCLHRRRRNGQLRGAG